MGFAHGGLGAYREDGDDNPHGAEHSIIDCLTGFQRVLDALVIAVKPPVVRLDGACLNDDEGQARWSRWNHHRIYQKKTREREKHQCEEAKEEWPTAKTNPDNNIDGNVNSLHLIYSLQRAFSTCTPFPPLVATKKGVVWSSCLVQEHRGRRWKWQGRSFSTALQHPAKNQSPICNYS